jgi:MFS transporter, DHA3 family, macrolide efflux protein
MQDCCNDCRNFNQVTYILKLGVNTGDTMAKKYNVWGALFFSEFGRAMYFIIITWILYKITKDAFYTGLLVSLGFLPSLFMNLLFGVIVDRLNRKLLSVLANFINVFVIVFIIIALAFHIINSWLIILVHMVIQLMGALFRPSIQAFTSDIFSKDELPKIYSQSGSASILGGLLGAPIGGTLIGLISAPMAMGVVALSYLFAVLSLVFLKNERKENGHRSTHPSFISDLIGGFSYLKRNTFLLSLFGVMFVGQLVFHSSVAFLSVYTKEYLNQTVTIYGFLDSSLSIGGFFAGFLGTWWWNKNTKYLSNRSLIVIFIGLLLVSFSPILPIAFIGVFFIGLGTTWIRILLQSVQQMATDKEFHGRMASFRMICNQGSVVISGPILGFIANHYGANGVYLALVIPVAIAIPMSLRQAKHEQFIKITNRVA